MEHRPSEPTIHPIEFQAFAEPLIHYIQSREDFRVPEVVDTLLETFNDPQKLEHFQELHRRYVGLAFELLDYDLEDIDTILEANRIRRTTGGFEASASHIEADGFLAALDEWEPHGGETRNGRALLRDRFLTAMDPQGPTFTATIARLGRMMTGGHLMFQRGGVISDQNPQTRRLIFGHTKTTNQEALLHFMLCHFLDLTFRETFRHEDGAIGELARGKDNFVNALTDAIAYHMVKNGIGEEDEIYKAWVTKRPDGMEWMSEKRLDAYRSAVKK